MFQGVGSPKLEVVRTGPVHLRLFRRRKHAVL